MFEHIKVGAHTNQSHLAGAICRGIRANREAYMTCIGHTALYQAIRGITIARRYLEEEGIAIYAQFDIQYIEKENKDVKDDSDTKNNSTLIMISITSRRIEEPIEK